MKKYYAVELCLHNSKPIYVELDKPVAVFSIEMPAEMFVLRQDDDWARLSSSVNRLAMSKVFVDDSSYLTTQTYSARLEKLESEHGKIGLVVVDYLQLMDAPEHKGNPNQRIGAISRELKKSAKRHVCPVVALSQLSRNVESRTDKRPLMSDIRESGQIEQDADLIVFVYRDEVYNDDSADKGVVELITAKQRNGEIGTTRAATQLEYCRFVNLAIGYDG